MEKRTMTVRELAEQLGIALPKAYELTEVKGFPCIRIGRRKVIPVAAFDKWLEDAAGKAVS